MESGAFEKSYIAIVSAIPEPEYGKIELPIGFESSATKSHSGKRKQGHKQL